MSRAKKLRRFTCRQEALLAVCNAPESGSIDVDKLAKLLGIPWSTADDSDGEETWTWSTARDAYMRDNPDASDEEADAAASEAETAELDERYQKRRNAFESAASSAFEDHKLTLTFDESTGQATIDPTETWRAAARLVLDTMNGVGQFTFDSLKDFLNSGPYTPREAAISHLGWIKWRGHVYGTATPDTLYDRNLR